MLIHIRPRIYSLFSNVVLQDVWFPEFDLALEGNKDVLLGRPYPNKNYHVAYRKCAAANGGRKHFDGIFLENKEHVSAFTLHTRWVLHTDTDMCLLNHIVKYEIIDQDFDTVTDNMILWGSLSNPHTGMVYRENRTPAHYIDPPIKLEPKYHLESYSDILPEQKQTFQMPTIQRDRLFDRWAGLCANQRIPDPAAAIPVTFKKVGV